MIIRLLTILVSMCVSSMSLGADASLVEALHAAIQKTIQKDQPVSDSGIAVSVFTSREVILSEGFGYKDRHAKTPVLPTTQFAIGSTTKAFTAMSALILQERGKLRLEDKVVSLLPEFRLADADRTERVELADLLSHAVGLPRHEMIWYLTSFDSEELIRRLPYLALNPKPGFGYREAFQYNNLMFLAAGEIVARQSGVPWGDFVRSEIWDRLEMRDSYFSWDAAKLGGDFAEPYREDVHLDFHDIPAVCPAGCVISNVIDMTKWIQAHLRRGALVEGGHLVSSEAFEQLIAKRMTMSEEAKLYYGLGWMMQDAGSGFPKVYFHGGNIDGFTAMVLFCPELDLGVVALSNQNATKAPNNIAVAAVAAYLDYLNGPPSSRHRQKRADLSLALDVERWDFARSTSRKGSSQESAAMVVGTYNHRGYGDVVIEQTGEGLVFDYFGHRWNMTPVKDLEFSVEVELLKLKDALPAVFGNVDGVARSMAFPFEPEVSPIEFHK
jgi:CubicO group peptidase (beta-lactamase class C family)